MAVETIPAPKRRENGLLRLLRRSERVQLGALLGPGLFWLVLFFAVPLLVIVLYSFLTPGPTGAVIWTFTLNNYARLFTESLFVNAYWRSLWIGVVTTVICLLVGYPLALFIVQRTPRWRSVLIFLVLIPFWTNFLVRTYAWMLILNNNGLINTLLQSLGFGRQTLLNTTGAVLTGLIYGELPFMVLPIYASLDRFDFTLLEAASDLGANRTRGFLRVMLPLTMPGVAAGSVLVFIPTVGQFVVSDLLGGAKVDLLGNLLQRLFTRSNPPNWPLGSAMALIFMFVLTVAVIFYFRVTTEEDR
ncbi:MAG TPA: ABC transporter permease [Roseiflexaceae bacterium]|jgi:spermidine/putrescine transport system permease protein